MNFKQYKHFLTYFGVKGSQYFDKINSNFQANNDKQSEMIGLIEQAQIN